VNSPEKDKAFFEAGLQQLETYILSKELYWLAPIHTTDFTQITPGAMLLVRERLKGWRTPGIHELSVQMEADRLKWRSAWDAKVKREMHARLELWKDYLHEARHVPDEFGRQYPYQVRQRVILKLLLDELQESPSGLMIVLDTELTRIWQNGNFVWDPALAWVFPQELFWFLYGTPKAQEK